MTLVQWDNLKINNVIKYERRQYKLLFKDPIGRWLTEVLDLFNQSLGFSKLVVKTSQVRGFSVIE